MPKVSVDTTWPFPATQKPYTPHEFEVAPKTKKTPAKKKPALKKATTRKKKD